MKAFAMTHSFFHNTDSPVHEQLLNAPTLIEIDPYSDKVKINGQFRLSRLEEFELDSEESFQKEKVLGKQRGSAHKTLY